jgi:hypothetical protein
MSAHHFRSWSGFAGLATLFAAFLAFPPHSTAQGPIKVEKIEFKGWKNALKIENADAELIATLDVGPRILSYRLKNGTNVLKEYADQLGKSGEANWQIRGGHRLWVSPEDAARTYAPDNGPISYEIETTGAVRLVQPPDAFGIKKTMAIKLEPKGSRVTITHTIENAGKTATTLAPWALTVMPGGGIEVIPQPPHAPHPGSSTNPAGPDDFLPKFSLVLWPYFEFSDPRWTFGKDLILLKHMPKSATKIGLSNTLGWAGYFNNGTLFLKQFAWDKDAPYPDRGVNYETFSNEDMVEMESLGPLAKLEPGGSVEHVEHWSLFPHERPVTDEADAAKAIADHLK